VADDAPAWCERPRDGFTLMIIDDWMALIVGVRDARRAGYAGPHPKRFAAIARRQVNLHALPSIDAVRGWALARSFRPIASVRDRADQHFGAERAARLLRPHRSSLPRTKRAFRAGFESFKATPCRTTARCDAPGRSARR
jgi:hypothetical protein